MYQNTPDHSGFSIDWGGLFGSFWDNTLRFFEELGNLVGYLFGMVMSIF